MQYAFLVREKYKLYCHHSVVQTLTMTDYNLDTMTTTVMYKICSIVLHCDCNLSTSTINRRLAAFFGLKPKSLVLLWYSLEGLIPKRAKLQHLLWALSFLKLYEFKEVRASRFQVDQETSCKWTKIMEHALSQLNLVRHNYYMFTVFSDFFID